MSAVRFATTPGPWHAATIRTHGANPSDNGCDIGADNGANVALVLHDPLDRETGETVANARLIAAAPDLLAALQRVDEWHSRAAVGEIDPEWDYETMVLGPARAAIARARGKS